MPQTLDFCCWDLNSITVHDFLTVLLIKAYNTVYSYELIRVAETYLISTDDAVKIDVKIDGFHFIKIYHPPNVMLKRGDVALYINDSLPSKSRPDLVTIPECM